MKNIAIFASGSGTNAENIARIFNEGSRIRVALVLTNRRNAGVTARMEPLGVPVTYLPNSVWDNDPQEVVRILREHDIDLVVLAGFMHYVAPAIVQAYAGRIVNIHPSLLPKFGGIGMYGHYVHEAVIAAGETESGVTVHYVTEETDKGEILMQEKVVVTPEDTPATLEAKIHPVEYDLYPRAILEACRRLDADGGNVSEKVKEEESAETPAAESAPADTPALTQEQDWAKALQIEMPEVPAQGAAVPPPVPGVAPAAPAPASLAASVGNAVPPALASSETPQAEPMPSTYMLWSVLATVLCCFVPGIVAILFSSNVSRRYYAGDIEGARRASRMAEIWIIVSFVAGLISATLWFPLALASSGL